MAFTDSIKFNGKSIRDFLTEVIEVKGRGIPKVRKRTSRIIGRHGDFTFGQTYDARIVKISGYVEGASHVTLMSNIDEIKNLFRMDDQILATGNESVSDGVEYGKLEFGDEADRYYRAIYNGTNILTEISQRWMLNDLKKIEIEFRCDDPFAYATSLSESTMQGSADEFKVFDLGTAENETIIELNGSVTDPVIVEGDKVGVAHFDYNDNLSDVEVTTVAGNFTSVFGFRSRLALTSQQSKVIQLVGKDNLFYDRGTLISGTTNYANYNINQGTMIFWVKPYWNGDDGIDHYLFYEQGSASHFIRVFKSASNSIIMRVLNSNVSRQVAVSVNSSNFKAGTWQMIVCRWDINNTIDSSSNFTQIDLMGDSEAGNVSTHGATATVDATLSIGQDFNNNNTGEFDGLIYHEFFERALTDAEVTALYNSGAGVEPFVTSDTKLLSAGELSSGDPVSVQYPWVDNKFTDGNQEVDPSAEWATTANVTVTNELTIVKYDLQSAKISWVSAVSNNRAELSTVALVNNQDYFYRFWIYVETLNASDELNLQIQGTGTILTRRLDTGTDDMGVSFATGTWLYYEGTFEADATSVHQFRIVKINANGDATVYVDQMDCQVNKIDNAGFEGTYAAGLAPNWNLSGTPTVAEENVIVHSGIASQKITATGTTEGVEQNITLSADTWHLLWVWARGAVGGETLQPQGASFSDAVGNTVENFILTTTFKRYAILFKTGSDTTGRALYRTFNGGTIYIDDAGIIELDTVVANVASAPTPEIDSYSEQKFDQGLLIDGADTLSWALKGNPNEGSIEVWLNPQFGADWENLSPVFYRLFGDTSNYVTLFYDSTDDKLRFRKRTAGSNFESISDAQSFTRNQRIHLLGTYGSGGVKLYIDSVIVSTVSADTSILATTPLTLYMSNDTQDQFPDSIVDEIYCYSREFSQQEVTNQFNKYRATKNDNAKIAMTKVLATDDKLRIDTENEVIEFLDSSLGTFTNAIASMNAGSNFFKMNAKKSVIYNKTALTNVSVTDKIKLNYLKRFL